MGQPPANKRFAKLIVYGPGGMRREVALDRVATTLGRDAACDIVIEGNYISRLHLTVERERDGYVVIDNDSSNGTFLNGRRVSGRQPLSSGDHIKLWDFSLTFEVPGGAESDRTMRTPAPLDAPVRCEASARQVWIREERVELGLSAQEFELLSLLCARYGHVCARDELGAAIWGKGNFGYNMLHRLVRRLKVKLGRHSSAIISTPAVGYRIELVPED